MKSYIYIIFLFLIFSCKDNPSNSLQKKKTIEKVKPSYSDINFFSINECCNEVQINNKKKSIYYTHNSENYDVTIGFFLKNKNSTTIINDISTIYNGEYIEIEIFKRDILPQAEQFNIIAISFPSNKLTPIYEGYDKPSYYDYTFPATISIYKYVDLKWLFLKKMEVSSSQFYELRDKKMHTLIN